MAGPTIWLTRTGRKQIMKHAFAAAASGKTLQLDQMTWMDVDDYLARSDGIILPLGSTEQHGPMGLIGTDTFCAKAVAQGAAEICKLIVAPAMAYTPAPFNTGFAGTVSVSPGLFMDLVTEVLQGLQTQGFGHIYILNGHGANLEPVREAMKTAGAGNIRLQSWWDFDPVRQLSGKLYGDWEGMHATPSEIAITQVSYRNVAPGLAMAPPEKLSRDFIATHAGDRHGPPDEHRRRFPDGRVGSHSALATPQQGQMLLAAAVQACARDIVDFMNDSD